MSSWNIYDVSAFFASFRLMTATVFPLIEAGSQIQAGSVIEAGGI